MVYDVNQNIKMQDITTFGDMNMAISIDNWYGN